MRLVLVGNSYNITIAIDKSYASGKTECKINNEPSENAGGILGKSEGNLKIKNFNFYINGNGICPPENNVNIIYEDGAECKKIVISPNTAKSTLKFPYDNKEYEVGTIREGADRLSATVTPHLDDKSGIKWESSNTDIVEIVSTDSTDGTTFDTLFCVIKCKAAGTSTITVSYTNEANASCVITVNNIVPGNVDGNTEISVNDASCLLKKVLDSNFKMPIEEKYSDYMKYSDVDGDGKLTAKDVAIILKKALDKKFLMPVEINNKTKK